MYPRQRCGACRASTARSPRPGFAPRAAVSPSSSASSPARAATSRPAASSLSRLATPCRACAGASGTCRSPGWNSSTAMPRSSCSTPRMRRAERMSGNTIGRSFCVTTFGESHGPAIGAVVDGCPPGLALEESDIQADLEPRRTGTSRHTSQRQEPDRVRILSGVFEGRTTGTPIGLIVDNVDARSRDYEKIKDRFRPGHTDYAYQQKYGFRDYRGGGRSSARITVATVAAGAIARKYLRGKLGLEVAGWLSQLGPFQLACLDQEAARGNPLFCAEPEKLPLLEDYLRQLRRDGDSAGARVSVRARRVPPGLGAPMFERLDADIAFAMMGINAAKAVEIGDGVAVAG